MVGFTIGFTLSFYIFSIFTATFPVVCDYVTVCSMYICLCVCESVQMWCVMSDEIGL